MAKKKTQKDRGNQRKATAGAFGDKSLASEQAIALENLDLEEQYSKAESFINNNKSLIFGVFGVLLAAVLGYFLYNQMYKAPMEAEASAAIVKAQQYFAVDSFNLALNGDGENSGFLDIVDDFSGTKIGNLANYYAGVSYLNLGNYEEAIDYLKAYDGKDLVTSAMALGNLGDCNMQLGNTDEGIAYYEKAATVNGNHFTSPMYHFRAGIAKFQGGDLAGAKKHFETIKNDFPESAQATDIDKYIAKLGS